MAVRIVVPAKGTNLSSRLSNHFGRAPYFLVITLSREGEVVHVDAIPNTGEHFGGAGKPAQRILALNPLALIVRGIGRRALEMFKGSGVSVYKAEVETVGEAVELYRKGLLVEVDEGCPGRS